MYHVLWIIIQPSTKISAMKVKHNRDDVPGPFNHHPSRQSQPVSHHSTGVLSWSIFPLRYILNPRVFFISTLTTVKGRSYTVFQSHQFECHILGTDCHEHCSLNKPCEVWITWLDPASPMYNNILKSNQFTGNQYFTRSAPISNSSSMLLISQNYQNEVKHITQILHQITETSTPFATHKKVIKNSLNLWMTASEDGVIYQRYVATTKPCFSARTTPVLLVTACP